MFRRHVLIYVDHSAQPLGNPLRGISESYDRLMPRRGDAAARAGNKILRARSPRMRVVLSSVSALAIWYPFWLGLELGRKLLLPPGLPMRYT